MSRMPELRPPPPAPADEYTAEYRSPARAAFAKTMVCVVVAVVLIVVTLVYYRSITIHEPTTAVVVTGDRSLDGAKIVVAEQGPKRRSWTVLLTHDNNWKTPVLLDPGEYHINITHAGNDVFAADFTLDPMQGWNIPLPSAVRVVGSEAIGDAVVTLIDLSPDTTPSSKPAPITLNQKNAFHATAYVTPGTYHVTATHDGHPVFATKLTIDRTTVPRIDLTKPPKPESEGPEEKTDNER